jgi:hypothetical protein
MADAQPPASLRLKTLARVAVAMESNAAAPIAMIGSARAHAQSRQGALDREAIVREILDRTALERRPTQHLWRAAALFLFAALAVALYFNAQQRDISSRMMDFVDRKLADDAARAIAQATSGFDFKHARALSVLDASGRPSKLIQAHLDEATGRVCVVGFGVDSAAQGVRVIGPGAAGQQLTLASLVIEDRGFVCMFDAPAGAGSVQLKVGGEPMTIVLTA